MVGDIPEGAPRSCCRGHHVGQEKGGTMIFTCPTCGGSFWQPQREKLRFVEAEGDRLIAEGRGEEALLLARRAVEENATLQWWPLLGWVRVPYPEPPWTRWDTLAVVVMLAFGGGTLAWILL